KRERARMAAHHARRGKEEPRSARAADTEVNRIREVAVSRIVDSRLLRSTDPHLERVQRLGDRSAGRLADEVVAREGIRREPAAAVVGRSTLVAGGDVAELGAIVERDRAGARVREVTVHQLIPLTRVARPGAAQTGR